MINFLALGDSYTIGEGVKGSESWPARLQHALEKHGILMTSPIILASTGWTAEELESALDASSLEGHYDLVSLMVGVNDQYRGNDVGDFEIVYNRLLGKASSLLNGNSDRLIALSIPDWGVTPFARDRNSAQIANEIDTFNSRAKAICMQKNIRYINVTSISRKMSMEPEMLAEDGLHPSTKQYEIWVKTMLPEILELLSRCKK